MKIFLSKQKLEDKLEITTKIFKKVGLDIPERQENNTYNSKRMNDIINAFKYWDKLKIGILPAKPRKIFGEIIYLPNKLREMFKFADKCYLKYS